MEKGIMTENKGCELKAKIAASEPKIAAANLLEVSCADFMKKPVGRGEAESFSQSDHDYSSHRPRGNSQAALHASRDRETPSRNYNNIILRLFLSFSPHLLNGCRSHTTNPLTSNVCL
ncbi:unnamed protein product [Linum trigynum]|uniref:Uncharacterized protein n=1 Tax=Linum trigynum TaxID=586398 RepID=A0AAV2FLM4_9ROSI